MEGIWHKQRLLIHAKFPKMRMFAAHPAVPGLKPHFGDN
jgi:hypothetical protein